MIEEAAKATGRSIRSLAANAGISDTRWRQIVKGWQPGPDGTKLEVHAPALTLARMALVLGLTSDDLVGHGRQDAGEALARLRTAAPGDMVTFLGDGADAGADFVVGQDGSFRAYQVKSMRTPINQLDEIDLIYASRMSAREKLLRIRQVLELRALAEAEEAERHKEAPAEAGADEQETQQS